MDEMQSQLLTSIELESKSQFNAFNQEKSMQNSILTDYKVSEFFTSPGLNPLNNKIFGLHSPSPIQRYNFKLVDELNFEESDKNLNMDEFSEEDEISHIPKGSSASESRKNSSIIEILERIPKTKN